MGQDKFGTYGLTSMNSGSKFHMSYSPNYEYPPESYDNPLYNPPLRSLDYSSHEGCRTQPSRQRKATCFHESVSGLNPTQPGAVAQINTTEPKHAHPVATLNPIRHKLLSKLPWNSSTKSPKTPPQSTLGKPLDGGQVPRLVC